VLALVSASTLAEETPVPPPDQNLVLAAPIKHWDEAIPLGNGLMGGLLWGEGNTVRLSLDRGDLWDERPAGEAGWWRTRTWKVGGDWDGPYNGVTPTKLPAGRLELTLDPSRQVNAFELNLATAEGRASFAGGGQLSAFFSAERPVALMRVGGLPLKDVELIPSGAKAGAESAGPSSGGAVVKLGYPAARAGGEGPAKWYVQDAANGFQYCACVETRRVGDQTLIAVAVTSTRDATDVLTLARRRCATALDEGYAAVLAPHVAWWRTFWAQSSVTLPEPDFQRYYVFSQYLYGAASRRGAPPMPLQGVWTADSGGLPPWKGDYHNDLNTQMTYMAYQEAGRFDEGACYLDFLWDLSPTFRAFAHDFYGTGGLATPGTMTLAGQPLGGWGQYSMSPTMTAWNAHLFYLHWRYTMDDAFLRDRAYPWCSQVGDCMLGLLKPGPDGVLVLQRSSSPEIFDNTERAWLIPNSNYDLSCLKMLFLSLQEMADACGKPADAARWAAAAAGLGDFHADAHDVLLLDAKTPLPGSHRHLSNLMGLYPFNLITREGTALDDHRIDASLAKWAGFGTRAWCGYTFAWMSCMRSRVGEAELALRNLDVFVHAFVLRNGFHANGDQTRSGFSGFTYRPFTLEGNFLASQAVQEMLLQSWSPTPGKRDTEVLRLFPATPWRWHDAAFGDLRAEGGSRVSARRVNNATVWFRVVAGADGVVRIRDNFNGRTPTWSVPGVSRAGDQFEVTLKRGQALEATLVTPAAIPDPPGDVAESFAALRANAGGRRGAGGRATSRPSGNAH
jgi:alpha-L-fucosidase 2